MTKSHETLEHWSSLNGCHPDCPACAEEESDMDTGPRVRMICKTCGGTNVMRDAWAVWDVDAQEWVLGAVFDAAHCDDCKGETSLQEVAAKEEPG